MKILLQTFLKSKHAVKLYINNNVDQALINECLRVVNRGIVVDLYLSETLVKEIEKEFFLLNNLIGLRAKGANIYIINNLAVFNDSQYICQSDFDSIVLINKDSSQVNLDVSLKEYDIIKNWFEDQNSIREYGIAEEDIQLGFRSHSNSIIEGTSTRIEWTSSNAQVVSIKGVGVVSLKGEIDIRFSKDTILIIEASSKNEIRRKALRIATIRELVINYDIQFLNAASNNYISLKNELNFDGVFGVFKGSKVKFSWKVPEADQVIIKPFGISDKTGERVFQINGTSEIEIHTVLQNQVKTKRIIIHEFPRPVFTENLIEIKDGFTSSMQLNIKDLRQKAIELIDNKGLANQEQFAKELRERINTREQRLMTAYNNMQFVDFYNDHSLPMLNKTIKMRLKSYFKNKSDVTDIINLLYTYDD